MNNQQNFSDFTKSERKIADFIEKNKNAVMYLNETELASTLGSSNATLSRFWRKIGYRNFKEFKKRYLEQQVITPKTKFERILAKVEDNGKSLQQSIFDFVQYQLTDTLEHIDETQSQICVKRIATCRKLFIYAPTSSTGLGFLLKHRLMRFGIDVVILASYDQELFEQILHLQENDCVFVFGFVKLTREAAILLDHAKEIKSHSIVLTDNIVHEFQTRCTQTFYVNRGDLEEFHSMVAATFFIEHLIVSLGQMKSEKALGNLEYLNNLREKYKNGR
ncbi:MurR/RpiR family transcriptional regulator [Psychrobacillus psychrodurans]|uniref:MurR/RpiR family transcriptional regulator n=1 Tax=Psychrobacillus psychrodurans TaxID=126157 RepID=UPI003CFD7634